MYRARTLVVLALVASLAIHPASSAAQPDPQPISQVRIAHAIPGAPAVDVLVDGARMVAALAFGGVSPYLNLPAGPHEFAFVPAGVIPPAAILTINQDLAPGQPYTLMGIGAPPAPPTGLVLMDERFTPVGGPARVRFVHASPNAPPVDVVLTSGATLFPNVAYGEATPYVDVATGTVTLQLRQPGTDTVVLSIPDVVLAVGTIYTFAAVGIVGGTPPLGPMPLIDS